MGSPREQQFVQGSFCGSLESEDIPDVRHEFVVVQPKTGGGKCREIQIPKCQREPFVTERLALPTGEWQLLEQRLL